MLRDASGFQAKLDSQLDERWPGGLIGQHVMCNAPVVPTSQTTTNHGTQSLKLLLGIGCGIPTVLLLAMLTGLVSMCGVCSGVLTENSPSTTPRHREPEVVYPDHKYKTRCFEGFYRWHERINELRDHRPSDGRIAPSCSSLLRPVTNGKCNGHTSECGPVSASLQRLAGSHVDWTVRIVAVSSNPPYVEFQCEDRTPANDFSDGIAFFESSSEIKFDKAYQGQLMHLQGVLVAGQSGKWAQNIFCLHLHGDSIEAFQKD